MFVKEFFLKNNSSNTTEDSSISWEDQVVSRTTKKFQRGQMKTVIEENPVPPREKGQQTDSQNAISYWKQRYWFPCLPVKVSEYQGDSTERELGNDDRKPPSPNSSKKKGVLTHRAFACAPQWQKPGPCYSPGSFSYSL